MACITCSKTKPVPLCTDTLQLGQTKYNSTSIFVFFKSSNGFQWRETETTDANGVLTVDLTNNEDYYSHNFEYEVWASLADVSTGERIPISVGNADHTCFFVSFDNIDDDAGALVDYTNHTLNLNESYTEVLPFYDFDGHKDVVKTGSAITVEEWTNLGSSDTDALEPGEGLKPDYVYPDLTFSPDEYLTISPETVSNTYMLIMILASSSAGGMMFSHFDGSDTSEQRFYMLHQGASGVLVHLVKDGSNNINRGFEGDLSAGLNLIELEFDGDEARIYIDGLRRENTSLGDTGTVDSLQAPTIDLTIGTAFLGGSPNSSFAGDIRHIKYFTSALSATQRQKERLQMLGEI